MAVTEIGGWSVTAGDNQFAIPDGAPDGWLGSDVNNVVRQLMAILRGNYADAEFLNLNWVTPNVAATITRVSNTEFTVAGLDARVWMTAGRRLEYIGSSTVYGTITSSSFSTDTSVIVVMDAGVIPTAGSPTKARVHTCKTLPGALFIGQTPTGTILDYVGTTIPTGYLACDGASVLRATYPGLLSVSTIARTGSTNTNTLITGLSTNVDLFVGMGVEGANIPAGATITVVDAGGTQITISDAASATASIPITFFPHGRADPTHFNVIDLGGYTPIGFKSAGDTDGEYRGIGKVYGEKKHTLTAGEYPAIAATDGLMETGLGTTSGTVGGSATTNASPTTHKHLMTAHTHAYSGAATAHENRPLSKVVNKIIKT